MQIEQLYEIAGSNFDEVLLRVPNKSLLCKLLKMFLNDQSKTSLDAAVTEKDPVAAFRAVHTLKGVTLSLGLASLSAPCHALTENLRPGTFGDGWEANYQNLCSAYSKVTDAIRELEV